MRVLKNIAWLVGLGVLAGAGALLAITFALLVISKMSPLKVEGYEVTIQSKVIERGLVVVDSEPTQESLQQASVYELHRGASSVNYQGGYNEVK